VIGGWGNSEVSFKTLIEIVAWFGSCHKQTGSSERAMDVLGDEAALHTQPEEVELGIVGDEARVLQDRLEWSQIVSRGTQIDGPDRSTLTAECEQANFTLPRIESIAFALAICFDIQSNARCSSQVGGYSLKIGSQ
jgi:hypothetical protein